MKTTRSLGLQGAVLLAASLLPGCRAPGESTAGPLHDVVVYGGTAGGAICAIQVARMGRSVVLIEPGTHLGGLTSGGLGATDIGNKAAIGGLARSFYRRVGEHYARPEAWVWQERESYRSRRQLAGEEEMWTFEPHVAEAILREMVAEAGVPVLYGERLELDGGVRMEGTRIRSIAMESGLELPGRVFVDATYEGDLMAGAGVGYRVGRESNAEHGETLNGVQVAQARHHQFQVPVDPWIVPGEPASGLLPGIQEGGPGRDGDGDARVQAYNFRMCLTDAPGNRLPFPRPEGYDPLRYELLLRYLQGGVWDAFRSNTPMPNRKTDTNNCGAFSTDNIGMSYGWPDGDHVERRAILEEHEVYQKGLMWFLSNDPRVPREIREEVGRWGLCRDEFVETGGWPHQLYVREARRMVSDYVVTQHDCQGRRRAADSVGLAAYTMDSHNVQRTVRDGRVQNEGDVQVGGFPPYPIAYRAIVPRAADCENLLVPVCLSSSHIAFGSIRMEPVFMVLGQSAATAACQAIEAGVGLQEVDVEALQARLRADGQVLAWPEHGVGTRVDPASLPGLVLDEDRAELAGEWAFSSSVPAFVGSGYLHDGGEGKGKKSARFAFEVEASGLHRVFLAWSHHPNRAPRVPVRVGAADGEHALTVDQRRPASVEVPLRLLGTFRFEVGRPGWVEVSNRETQGHVIADAVQVVEVGEGR